MRADIRIEIVRLGLALTAMLAAAGPAAAGIGTATSGPVAVDTVPPVISGLTAPTGGATFASPDAIVFGWDLQDDSPALLLEGHRADVLASGDVLASVEREFLNGHHAWNWPVAEAVSGSCRVRVTARDIYGNQSVAEAGDFRILLPGTDAPPSLRAPRLAAPAPNPFNPQTDLAFEIGEAGRARLAIHDAAGRLVRTLVDAELPTGRHVRAWDGRDDAGRHVSGGAYLVRLTVDGRAAPSRKVVLLP
ncbi:MAG: hypothetical protein IPI34_12440 [bacterium]|nr:hypothetical protein [bacterium]